MIILAQKEAIYTPNILGRIDLPALFSWESFQHEMTVKHTETTAQRNKWRPSDTEG